MKGLLLPRIDRYGCQFPLQEVWASRDVECKLSPFLVKLETEVLWFMVDLKLLPV